MGAKIARTCSFKAWQVQVLSFLTLFKRQNVSCIGTMLKRIKYEIRLGKPNRPIGEPNRPMSTSPKKVEPILCVGPWQDEGPDLPTMFQETCSARMRGLLYKDEKLALQGWEACSARMRGLLYKDEKLALQGWEACSAGMRGLLHKERRQDLTTIKRPQHPQKRYA